MTTEDTPRRGPFGRALATLTRWRRTRARRRWCTICRRTTGPLTPAQAAQHVAQCRRQARDR